METQRNKIDHKSSKVLFAGSSGTGKTNAFIKYIYGSDFDSYFIFDHQGEILDRLNAKGLELEAFEDFESITEYFEQKKESEESGSDVIVFDPSANYAGIYEETFEEFCSFVFELASILDGKKLFVADELQMLTGNQYIGRPLQSILQTGRRKQLDCAFCSQACNELHNKIRQQITDLFAFRTIEENALKWIKGIALPSPERLLRLEDGQAIWFNTKTGREEILKINLAT